MLILCYCMSLMLAIASTDDGKKWNDQAQKELTDALNLKPNIMIAKNVILFLGDGMGVSTVSAARLYKAQKYNITEGMSTLAFEHFPHVALSKTYNLDAQTPDSAGTGTAFLCGVKANAGTLGVNGNVARKNCTLEKGNEVMSILHWSKAEGKSVGVVTTSRITHATPAAAYAHSAERDWENDANLNDVEGNCTDIAKQLIMDNPDIEVILGGGRRNFFTIPVGQRNDSLNLTQIWETDKSTKGKGSYVTTKSELDAVDVTKTDFLLGLFAESHMEYDLDRELNNSLDQPSLPEMTKIAIDILKKNDNGFFLLVEGARIDHGHHASKARKALHDTIAFDDAVNVAMKELGPEETLLVVTADHSHVFSMAGYPETGNDILGLVHPVADGEPKDNVPYTSLIYGNGPGGALVNGTDGHPGRQNLTGVDTTDPEYVFQAAVHMSSETHSAEDVGIFAIGPMSHLFHGVHDQNYIAHVMAYASCVGPNKKHCDKSKEDPVGSGVSHTLAQSLIIIFILHHVNKYL
ncbi:alkaline phosphatase [Patella vulgata]|uniref:alkaline phosphatase n=1 Tax=Patella vulgata TaxID=6465 RepID=UPI00217FA5ED|nr:alkaline phosphatase [Patella vulgata]XP_050415132.1 alkaline phosphatase [Patella vulgata]XP_050415133.1 alkaline phosphatase [Patella vulgata]